MNNYGQVSTRLRTGTLHVTVDSENIPLLDRLLGFASRINSKRGFLLVSKVLGKHYPVTPRNMAWSYQSLANILMELVETYSSSLWLGMAETATGLGYGVYEAAHGLGVNNALFMQTTRYQLSEHQNIKFIEAHSHATDFLLYWPVLENDREVFLKAKQLVLIDDEISTGATFSRLVAAYRLVNPELESVVIASLVNFASDEDRKLVEDFCGIPVHWVALLHGALQFDSYVLDEHPVQDKTINVIGNGSCKQDILAWPGRLGINKPIKLSKENIEQALTYLPENEDKRPILVLGTGECNPPAFLLGRAIEDLGYEVIVQATTRSPIIPEGIVASRIVFKDNYQDNIHNFIYNINPDEFRLIIVCHETPLIAESNQDDMCFVGLIKHLNAVSAQFSHRDLQNAEFHFYRP